MPGNRQAESKTSPELEQESLDNIHGKIATDVNSFISLIKQFSPEEDVLTFTSSIEVNRQFLIKIDHQVAQFNELQVSLEKVAEEQLMVEEQLKATEEQLTADEKQSLQTGEELQQPEAGKEPPKVVTEQLKVLEQQLKLKTSEKQLYYTRQLAVIYDLIRLGYGVLLNMDELLNQSRLNDYIEKIPESKMDVGNIKNLSYSNIKDIATRHLEFIKGHVERIAGIVNKIKKKQHEQMPLSDIGNEHKDFTFLSNEDIDTAQQYFDLFAWNSMRKLSDDLSGTAKELCKKLQRKKLQPLSLSESGRELWVQLRTIYREYYRHELGIDTLSTKLPTNLEKQIAIINKATKDDEKLKKIVDFADKVSKIACLSEKAYEAGRHNESEIQLGLLISIVDEASRLVQFYTTFFDDFFRSAAILDDDLDKIRGDFIKAGSAIATMKDRLGNKLVTYGAKAQENSQLIERFLLYTDKLISSRFHSGEVQFTPAYFVDHELKEDDLTIPANDQHEALKTTYEDAWDFLLAIKFYEQWKHDGEIPLHDDASGFAEEIAQLTQKKSSPREQHLKRLSASQLLTEEQRLQMEKFSQALKAKQSKGTLSEEAMAIVELAEIFAKIYVTHEAYLNADDNEKFFAIGSRQADVAEVAIEKFKQHQKLMEIFKDNKDIFKTLGSAAALYSPHMNSEQKGEVATDFPDGPANETEFVVRQGLNTVWIDLLIQVLPNTILDENRHVVKPQEELSMSTNSHPTSEVRESSLSSPGDSGFSPPPSRKPPSPSREASISVDSGLPPMPPGKPPIPPSREPSRSVDSGLPPMPSGKPPISPSREASISVDSKPPALPSAPKPAPYKPPRPVGESKSPSLSSEEQKASSSAPVRKQEQKQKQKEEIIFVEPKPWWQGIADKLWGADDAENRPLLASEQEREAAPLLQDEKNPDAQDSVALLDNKLASLRRSLTPLSNEQKPDTSWVSAALLDSQLIPFVEDMLRIPDSWSLQLRNGFIEAVSPKKPVGESFAGTNQQCMIALTGLKLPLNTLGNNIPQKGGQAQSQYYNSACTADLITRLTSIADATESSIKNVEAKDKVRELREPYLDKIQQLNLEELFAQLDKEEASGKAKRFSLKDWITTSLFTDAKGWSAFYKEYQRQHPVSPKHKEIARRIKQAGEIMADYLREAQKIAAQYDGKPFKIKDVAKQESHQIGEKGRSTFIGLFDFAGNIFADWQRPIGESTVPSSNRGLTHKGYANFVKTGLCRYNNGRSELLFQGYRHSAAPPIDIKSEKTKIARTKENIETGLAQQFADILQPRLDSKELDPQNYASKESALPMSVASLSLLTPEHGFLKPFHDKGSNNAQLALIDKAFTELDGKALPVTLKDGRTIYVRPDICLMNAPTNHAGAIHYYSPEDFNGINQRGFAKLIGRIQEHLKKNKEKFNTEVPKVRQAFESLLDAYPADRQRHIDAVKATINTFWADAGNKTDSAKEQCNFLQLAVEIIEIQSRGLRENALNMLEFQACFMMLNYMMGGIVEMYCKSGKDRTGAVDEMIKAKYLSQYAEGANGRFFSYTPLAKRVDEHGLDSTFKFINGPLATMQRCGASPFAAGQNTYGAGNLQRNGLMAAFASGAQTLIDLALAKLNKKPFSLANAKAGKKVVMALGGVLLLAPALLYSAGQFINHHLIQRPIRFYRANYGNVSLRALAAEELAKTQARVLAAEAATKAKAREEDVPRKKKRSHSLSSIDAMSLTTVRIAASPRKRAQSDGALLEQLPISEAQATLRETMAKGEAYVGQLKGAGSSANDEPGKAQVVLGQVPAEVVEAGTFVDVIDSRKNEPTDKWRQVLTGACSSINEYFASLPSNSHTGKDPRVIANNGHVFIGELFKENVTKGAVRKLKPESTVDNNSNAYAKSQEALTSLVVLSLPNSGIIQNKQGAYVIQQSDGKFVPPTLQLTVGKNFRDLVTLRNVLAIMLKVRELLEEHNRTIDPGMSVELEVIVQRDNSEETICFSKEDGLQRIKALAPNTRGSLMAKANAREKQVRAAFDKFDLALNTPGNKHVPTHKIG